MEKKRGGTGGLHYVKEVPKFLQQFAPMLEKKEPERKRGGDEKFNPEEEEEFHRQAIAQALGDAGVSAVAWGLRWRSDLILSVGNRCRVKPKKNSVSSCK